MAKNEKDKQTHNNTEHNIDNTEDCGTRTLSLTEYNFRCCSCE